MEENDRLLFSGDKKNTSNIIKKMLKEDVPNESSETIVNVPIDLIDHLQSFEHPFDKSVFIGLEELAEKIKLTGVLEPVTLRPIAGGRYEILAGHRRTEASKLAKLDYIPAIIRECDLDTAKLIVTDTNLERREKILPSEKAKAYRLQMESLKNQGKRMDLLKTVDSFQEKNNLCSTGTQVKSRDIVATMNNSSPLQISRFLRLNELIEPLLNLVDEEAIPFRAAVAMSYLRIVEQQAVFELLEENKNIKLTIEIAEELKTASKEMELTKIIIEATINPPSENEKAYFLKPQKPMYEKSLMNIKKYISKLDGIKAEKLTLISEDELEKRIRATVDEYLDSL